MNNKFRLITTVFVSALSINSALALPIDWSGVFGADTHMLSNTCRTSDKIAAPKPLDGSQGLVSNDCSASFSTYTFRLNPSIIVNDGVTFKGELSTGGIRGNFMGGDAANSVEGANNSYFFTAPAQNSSLNINQAYMELYADTALVRIGRMSKNFGMGLTISDGSKAWDRFYSIYDGIDAEMKIGNFSIIPHYAMISNVGDDAATSTPQEASGKLDVKEMGMTAKYENKNRDLVASLFYAQRSSKGGSTFYQANDTTTPPTPPATSTRIPRGKTDVTIIAPYVSKKWDRLTVAAEGSYQTGKFGHIYSATETSKISATAFAVDVKYELNPKWEVGVLAGSASGNDASSSKFGASYLNPNFQIADLMFRYNYAAINEGGRSIFDSSVTNANFVRLFGNYKTDKWTWKGAFIMATANETAKAGKAAYHHEENYKFDSQAKQDSSYGYEFDFGFDYRWNPNVTIGAYYAYWMVGDYYAFSNTADKLDLKNVHGGGLRATLEF